MIGYLFVYRFSWIRSFRSGRHPAEARANRDSSSYDGAL